MTCFWFDSLTADNSFTSRVMLGATDRNSLAENIGWKQGMYDDGLRTVGLLPWIDAADHPRTLYNSQSPRKLQVFQKAFLFPLFSVSFFVLWGRFPLAFV
jgi:hypothetical protein